MKFKYRLVALLFAGKSLAAWFDRWIAGPAPFGKSEAGETWARFSVRVDESLLAETQKFWSKKLGRPISENEAIGIISQFRSLLQVVREVKEANHAK